MYDDEKNAEASSELPVAKAVLKYIPSQLETACCGGKKRMELQWDIGRDKEEGFSCSESGSEWQFSCHQNAKHFTSA